VIDKILGAVLVVLGLILFYGFLMVVRGWFNVE